MTSKKEFVSTRPVPGVRNSAGIGYIIIPIDVSRDKYIANCYRTSSVSIAFENGGSLDQISVSKNVLREIEFPIDNTQLGSLVLWVNLPKFNHPVIIGVIAKTDEIEDISEKQFLLNRTTEIGHVEIAGDAKSGTLFINVESFTDKDGAINIVLKNKTKTAKLNVKVLGDVNIESEGNINLQTTGELNFTIQDLIKDNLITTIKYKKGEGFTYEDEFGNQQVFNTAGVQLQDGSLGGLAIVDKLVEKYNNLENLVNNLISLYNTHIHIAIDSITAAPITVAPTVSLQSNVLIPTQALDIENTDVTHGKKSE